MTSVTRFFDLAPCFLGFCVRGLCWRSPHHCGDTPACGRRPLSVYQCISRAHFVTIVNNADVNKGPSLCVIIYFHFPNELTLAHMVIEFKFLKNCQVVTQYSAPFYFPTSSVCGFQFLRVLATYYLSFKIAVPVSVCEVASYCGSNFLCMCTDLYGVCVCVFNVTGNKTVKGN